MPRAGTFIYLLLQLKLAVRIEVSAFDILEVTVSTYLELLACCIVGYDKSLGMHLKG